VQSERGINDDDDDDDDDDDISNMAAVENLVL
jgi:hypothetical protein